MSGNGGKPPSNRLRILWLAAIEHEISGAVDLYIASQLHRSVPTIRRWRGNPAYVSMRAAILRDHMARARAILDAASVDAARLLAEKVREGDKYAAVQVLKLVGVSANEMRQMLALHTKEEIARRHKEAHDAEQRAIQMEIVAHKQLERLKQNDPRAHKQYWDEVWAEVQKQLPEGVEVPLWIRDRELAKELMNKGEYKHVWGGPEEDAFWDFMGAVPRVECPRYELDPETNEYVLMSGGLKVPTEDGRMFFPDESKIVRTEPWHWDAPPEGFDPDK